MILQNVGEGEGGYQLYDNSNIIQSFNFSANTFLSRDVEYSVFDNSIFITNGVTGTFYIYGEMRVTCKNACRCILL